MTVAKWNSKLARIMKAAGDRKGIQDVFVTVSTLQQECINTGSTVLNMLIGGSRTDNGKFVCPGYPKSSIIEIYGRESSGKSTLALTAMGQVIADDPNACGLYIDNECAVVDKYAKRLGVDFRDPSTGGSGRAVRAQPRTFEETETLVMMAALEGVDLIVVDSVAGLVSKREAQRDTSDDKQRQGIAEVPRLMSLFLPKLQSVIARTKTTVIFLNQVRDKIGVNPMVKSEEGKISTPGGNALKFYSKIRMSLKPRMTMKAKRFDPISKLSEDVQIATDIEVKMVKNKIDATQGHKGLITIRYGVGVDELRTMLNVAEMYKIITKGKLANKQTSYAFSSPTTGVTVEANGIERFRLEISRPDNRPILQEMIALCQDQIISGFRSIDDEELANLAEDAVVKTDSSDDDYESDDTGSGNAELSDNDEEGLDGTLEDSDTGSIQTIDTSDIDLG